MPPRPPPSPPTVLGQSPGPAWLGTSGGHAAPGRMILPEERQAPAPCEAIARTGVAKKDTPASARATMTAVRLGRTAAVAPLGRPPRRLRWPRAQDLRARPMRTILAAREGQGRRSPATCQEGLGTARTQSAPIKGSERRTTTSRPSAARERASSSRSIGVVRAPTQAPAGSTGRSTGHPR